MTLSRQHRHKRKWQNAREKIENEGNCRSCGWNGELEAAHVAPRSLGGRDEQDSVIPLCHGCHTAQHNGDLDLLPLLTRDEEIEAVRVLGIARAFRYLTTERGEHE